MTLGLTIALVVGFDTGVPGLQYVVDESWIPGLGVRFQLGVDGISLFLVVMTALLWAATFAWSAWRLPDRPKNYFLMLGIGEFAVMGAFLAQDLLLFVLFFDLMLVPFFFLVGSYGTGDRVRATIKMMVYTLVGSLLMLVAAIATAVLTAESDRRALVRDGGPARERPARGKPGVDLPLLRRGVPGEDADLPAPRLDARRLPRRAAAGPRAALGRPAQGRRLRLPARRAADLPRRDGRSSRS